MLLNRQITSTTNPNVITPLIATSDYELALGEIAPLRIVDSQYNIKELSKVGAGVSVSNSWNVENATNAQAIEGLKSYNTYTLSAKYSYSEMRALNFQENMGVSYQEALDSVCDIALGFKNRDLVLHGVLANEGLLANSDEIQLSSAWKSLDSGKLLQEILSAIAELRNNQANQIEEITILMPYELSSYIELLLLNTSTFLNSGSTETLSSALQMLIKKSIGIEVKIGYDATLIDSSNNYQMLIVATKRTQVSNDKLMQNVNALMSNTLQARSDLTAQTNPAYNGYMSGYQFIKATSGIVTREKSSVILKQTLN